MAKEKIVGRFVTPETYAFPLHHPRPRFKNYVEDVLGYVSFGIVDIGQLPRKAFNNALDSHISHYGSNLKATKKTIQNWRTEIAAIFGLYIEDNVNSRPSFQCEDLAINTNLPRFFRGVMASFQYPAGFHKPNEVVKMVEAGVKFSPGRWLAEYFLSKNSNFITKEEFCHCVMNDLRVTRDNEDISKTIERIQINRKNGVKYDSRGDVVRYAGDVLDYMFLASFLDKDADGKFSMRPGSANALKVLKDSSNFFERYYQGKLTVRHASMLEYEWFLYQESSYKLFASKMDELDASDRVCEIKQSALQVGEKIPSADDTAAIGRAGEQLAFRHEIARVSKEGRDDLVHLIKQIPTHLAAGYDIKSIEADTEEDRFIEVKTCVSRKRVSFNNFHLTPNEWRVADGHGDRYFIYRIAIDDEGVQMFVIQNPIQKFRDRQIRLSFHHSVQLTFTDKAGVLTELLCTK